jgi:CheY-like chemotaxis protein
MPDVDGWQVLEAVKHNPLWRQMPVVVVSGQANGAGDVARVSSYDGFFVEKTGDFAEVIKTALGRLLCAA